MSAVLGLAHQPDRRALQRNRVAIDAKIVSRSLWCMIECTIRDRSEAGAKLYVPAKLKLPSTFDLAVPSEHIVIPVRCIWRRGEWIGVQFVGKPKEQEAALL